MANPLANTSILDQVVNGDLRSLTPAQRASYYQSVCESLNLNPLTQPLLYVTLNGKLVLYATKGATDQLRNLRGISIEVTGNKVEDDLAIVTVRGTIDGRHDEEMGIVSVAGLRGEALANARLKAITKAKRRLTLSLCGLGMLDETEVESIPTARTHSIESLHEQSVDVPPVPLSVGHSINEAVGLWQAAKANATERNVDYEDLAEALNTARRDKTITPSFVMAQVEILDQRIDEAW